METLFFTINGYWKDDRSPIDGYLVYAYDNSIEGGEFDDYPYSDDDVFYYGLSEDDIKLAIEEGEDNALEFVITSYEKA